MPIIKALDRRGNGYLASVNSGEQLLTRSVIISALAEAALRGDAYSWRTKLMLGLPDGATGLCVINNSSSKYLVISSAYVWTGVARQVKFHLPAPGVWAGTVVDGVNLNTNYANSSPAFGYANETGNIFVAANTIETVYLPVLTNGEPTTGLGVHINFNDAVILGNNDALAADWFLGAGKIECTFVGYFIDVPG